VVARSADEAIEAAAVGFSTDIRKLIAVRRFEIALRGRVITRQRPLQHQLNRRNAHKSCIDVC
jgi:hypothetical protein